MKLIINLSLIILLFSCSKKEENSSGNILDSLTISVDTVIVDSKGKLLELNRGPSSSSVSENGKYLYLFNSRTHQIQQINLDQLEWERDFDFEVEGPNGISDMVLKTQTLDDSTFVITAFNKLGTFSIEGTKLKNFSISSLPLESDLQELDYSVILTKDLKSIFSLPGVRYQGPRTFAKIDLQTYEIDNFSIKEMNWIFDLKIGTSAQSVFQESMYLVEVNNQILALSPSSSSFYRYDLKTDSLNYHSFIHQLSPITNETKLKTIVESDQEYHEEMRNFFMGMYFGPLKWDESNKLYFRFGRKANSIDDTWQISSSQVFMYAYDENFNLIGEAELPEEIKFPRDFFFKDGKLWSYINIEDELGFAIFTFDF
ncbi:DUF4221 domain-containing protein [Algoriphagus machipongonensis]|uniref:Lipoprotein n=1 Tax=Algoriphagus machipongonensis TaxID=388413 RepID=A3HUB1_9BACT|nr:DUF4221 domain-containing protein [Algoriphagus machipongonensis]EAZ81733.1 hypothetical protein ALPR1_00790 [Algoriphagus machipongonensis]